MSVKALRKLLRYWLEAIRFEKWWRLAVFALVVGAVMGLLIGGPIFLFSKWKIRQARLLSERGEGYRSQSRLMDARMSWETALRLNPNEPRALAGLARWHETAGESLEALHAWQRLAESGGMSPGDAAAYLQTALRQGEEEIALGLANSFAGGGDRAMPHLVRAELNHSKGELASAEKELRLAADRDSTPRSGMLLALHLLRNGQGGASESEGFDLLRGLGQREDAAGLHALRELLASGRISREETRHCLRHLRSHPLVDSNHHLLADFHELNEWPENREAILQSASDRLAKSSAGNRAEALPWMLQVGGPALAMPLLTPDEARSNPAVFPVWLQAHALGDRWDVVLEACESPGAPLAVHMRHLYRGRAMATLGRPGDSAAAYAEARSAGSGNPEAAAEISAYLLLAGEEDLFRETLRESLATAAPVDPFFQKIVSTARQLGDAGRLREIYRSAASHPELAANPSFQNDLVLLDLLLGGQADLSATAYRLEANPNDFSMRTTHALANLQAGLPDKALGILSGGEKETRISELPAMHQAIAAAILAAAGRQQEALQIANAIPARAIGLQERELLARHLSGNAPEIPGDRNGAEK
jgi:hypothetical protein